MAAGTWFVLIPQNDAGNPASYLRRVDFRAQFDVGSSEYTALQQGKSISYDGMQMVKWKGPFQNQADAQKAQAPLPSPSGTQALGHAADQWLSTTGGNIASGIEGGVVAIIKDLWNVIVGPLLVIAGIAVAIAVLIAYFKNDILQAGKFIGAAASAGAL